MKAVANVKLTQADWNVSPKVTAFTTTIAGGMGVAPYKGFNLAHHVGDDTNSVLANREQLAKWFDFDVSFQWLNQVHGIDVVKVDTAAEPYQADALITDRYGLACCVLTADCLPVFIAAKDGSEVAIAHAGWRGLVAGVIEKTVASMKTPASETAAFLGPAIGPCHFEVGADVLAEFKRADSEMIVDQCFQPASQQGKYLANLFELARIRLNRLGVEVNSSGRCTVCEAETFYSYRRSKVTGRMGSIIVITA